MSYFDLGGENEVHMTPSLSCLKLFNTRSVLQVKLTEFLQHVLKCIAEWGKKSGECNGNIECLQTCSRDLRACLDAAFPDSRKIEFESDKINYVLSSIFFLTNRISKASIGLAELDKIANDIKDISHMNMEKQPNKEGYEKMRECLDEIIAKYF